MDELQTKTEIDPKDKSLQKIGVQNKNQRNPNSSVVETILQENGELD